MVTIAMKSKGSLDRNSILSINQPHPQGAFTARSVTALNKPLLQREPYTPNGTQSQSFSRTHSASQAASRPQAHSASQAASRPRTQTASKTAAPPRTQTAVPSAAPVQQKIPQLIKPVRKGQKAPLTADQAPGILKACFGWNASNAQCDADVSAFLLGADGKVIGDSWFVFYGQTESPDKCCRFEYGPATDRESITINLRHLNPNVKKIVFVLTIHEAFAKRLHFGMMKDAYVRILDQNQTEIVSFQMQEYYSNVISMMIGEIYQYNGSWKFNAVGNGVAKDLAGLCALYGVEVTD